MFFKLAEQNTGEYDAIFKNIKESEFNYTKVREIFGDKFNIAPRYQTDHHNVSNLALNWTDFKTLLLIDT